MGTEIPVVDVGPLLDGTETTEVAGRLAAACRAHGFFLVTGHGVDTDLEARLDAGFRAFFARPDEEKEAFAMGRAGPAWRGWFPVGAELTSGEADRKEGVYIGAEHPVDHPRVRGRTALHGANLLPTDLRDPVLAWLDAMTALGRDILRGLALGLGLPAGAFDPVLTDEPTILLRAFHYPPVPADHRWGVGEHTDYGLLTILRQDSTGGLEVRVGGTWVEAPPLPGTFVCNLGDMLERMTGGTYRSTPHRVRSPEPASITGPVGRLSFPFFLDPGWDVRVTPLPVGGRAPARTRRWDGEDPLTFDGTYGEYLTSRVARVFPDLFASLRRSG